MIDNSKLKFGFLLNLFSLFLVIHVFAKRDLSEDSVIKDGDLHLQVLELIKDEFKVWMCDSNENLILKVSFHRNTASTGLK